MFSDIYNECYTDYLSLFFKILMFCINYILYSVVNSAFTQKYKNTIVMTEGKSLINDGLNLK